MSELTQELLDKIELLTTELEKSSEVLSERAIECEQWKLKYLSGEHKYNQFQLEHNILNQQFVGLSELLQQRVVEVEETKNNSQSLKSSIKYKDCEEKIYKLTTELQNQASVMQKRTFEVESNRLQTISKIQELQDERQKGYHSENYIKQLKAEKFQALHFLKLKQDEFDQSLKQIDELEQFRVLHTTVQIDLENVRQNYNSLYEQHVQEIEIYKQRIDVQRQVNENNMVIMSEQNIEQILQEKASLDMEKNEKVYTAVVQLENRIQTLSQIIETKNIEIEQIKLYYSNEIQEASSIKNLDLANQLRILTDQLNMYEMQQQGHIIIQERNQIQMNQADQYASQMQTQYKEQLEILDLFSRKYQDMNAAFQQSEAKKNELELTLKAFTLQISQYKDLILQQQSQLTEVRQYQIKIAELESSQQISKNREQSFDQLRVQAVNEKKIELNEADQKIKYLLRLLEQREQQIAEIMGPKIISQPVTARKTGINLQQQTEIFNRRQSMSQIEILQALTISNMFYHQADEEFQQGQSRF